MKNLPHGFALYAIEANCYYQTMEDNLQSLCPTTEELHTDFTTAQQCQWNYVISLEDTALSYTTACECWTIRDLINHVVTSELVMLAVSGDGPMPSRGTDNLSSDWRHQA